MCTILKASKMFLERTLRKIYKSFSNGKINDDNIIKIITRKITYEDANRVITNGSANI